MDLSSVFGLRRHKRFAVDLDATVHESRYNLHLKARIKDISRGGLMLYCRDSFEPGVALHVDFQVPPTEESPASCAMNVNAKVTRCLLRPDGTFFEVALDFRELGPEQGELLSGFLHRLGG